MDQGILEALKGRHKMFLCHLVLESKSSSLCPRCCKEIENKRWCTQSWDEAIAEPLQNDWYKMFLSKPAH